MTTIIKILAICWLAPPVLIAALFLFNFLLAAIDPAVAIDMPLPKGWTR